MMPAPRVILLVGAPSFADVDDESCTVKRFSEPFIKILDVDEQDDAESGSSYPQSSQAKIAWRSLPATRRPLHTGFSQNHEFYAFAHDYSFHQGNKDFFTTAEITALSQGSEGHEAEMLFTRFCEESLTAAHHQSAPTGHVEVDDESFEQSCTFEETSMMTSTGELNTTIHNAGPLPISGQISDLKDIPSASRIAALNPQTLTKNLIVAVISIAQPRAVTTRWGTHLSLVEVLVSDDTKSGFSVTFWLSGGSETASEVIAKLRRQDVILLENVALIIFQGKVYGQSLRRGLTRISLLWRRDGSGNYSTRDLRIRASASCPQLAKTRLVKDWVIRFVGRDSNPSQVRGRRKSWDKPPDHSQD